MRIGQTVFIRGTIVGIDHEADLIIAKCDTVKVTVPFTAIHATIDSPLKVDDVVIVKDTDPPLKGTVRYIEGDFYTISCNPVIAGTEELLVQTLKSTDLKRA